MEEIAMKSKLTKYTNDLKAQKWTEIVVNCNESGMSKTAWCRENNVSIKSFFYRQHKLRMKMIESSPTAKAAEIFQINLQEETIVSATYPVIQK
jgi:putative transposase